MNKKKRVRKRKCLGCWELFLPDPRTRDRQRFCSKPECKCKSKAWRQRRWLSKKANQFYFSGPEEVARVQCWRKENPSYAKDGRLRKKALQDDCESQVLADEEDVTSLTDCALQDDIASSIRKIHSRGEAVLAMETTKIGDEYEDQKTVVTPRAGASSP